MSGQIVINIPNPRVLERILYWIIIIVLVALLVFSYMGDNGSETKKTEEDTDTTTEPTEEDTAPAEPEPEPVVPDIDETCSDDIENQDETDVDCGGICTDINGEYWYDNKCNKDPEPEEPELSGKVEFSVSNVVEEVNENSGALKVVSFKVKVTNGKSDNIFPTVIAHAKDGASYLSQTDGSYDEEDGDDPYMGPFDFGKIESGESVTMTFGGDGDSGGYPWSTLGGYSPGDEFKLVVELLDEDGDRIDQYSKTIDG